MKILKLIIKEVSSFDIENDILKQVQAWLQLGIIFSASLASLLSILAAIYHFQLQKWYASNTKNLKKHQKAIKIIIWADIFLWIIVLGESITWNLIRVAINKIGQST